MICRNCGAEFVYEIRTHNRGGNIVTDTQPMPYDATGENGCVWEKDAPHPCGGVYDIGDYHQSDDALAAVVAYRMARDSGRRHDLGDVMAELGIEVDE
jgi:hypothetical protein